MSESGLLVRPLFGQGPVSVKTYIDIRELTSRNNLEHTKMPFDFDSFLLQETGVKWDVQELFGGTANFTVRVQGTTTPATPGLYPDVLTAHPSAVLKQAPPYLAKDPSIPFSPYRQVSVQRTFY